MPPHMSSSGSAGRSSSGSGRVGWMRLNLQSSVVGCSHDVWTAPLVGSKRAFRPSVEIVCWSWSCLFEVDGRRTNGRLQIQAQQSAKGRMRATIIRGSTSQQTNNSTIVSLHKKEGQETNRGSRPFELHSGIAPTAAVEALDGDLLDKTTAKSHPFHGGDDGIAPTTAVGASNL